MSVVHQPVEDAVSQRGMPDLLVPAGRQQSDRLSGCEALTSVFRNSWLVERHPEEKGMVVMARTKGNLAPEDMARSLKFHIENVSNTGLTDDEGNEVKNIGRLIWDGEVEFTADALLQAAVGGGKRIQQKAKQQEVESIIRDFFSKGAKKHFEISLSCG